jgi:hypothetical protein
MARQLVPVEVEVADPTPAPTHPPHDEREVSVSMHSKPPGRGERNVSSSRGERSEERKDEPEGRGQAVSPSGQVYAGRDSEGAGAKICWPCLAGKLRR